MFLQKLLSFIIRDACIDHIDYSDSCFVFERNNCSRNIFVVKVSRNDLQTCVISDNENAMQQARLEVKLFELVMPFLKCTKYTLFCIFRVRDKLFLMKQCFTCQQKIDNLQRQCKIFPKEVMCIDEEM